MLKKNTKSQKGQILVLTVVMLPLILIMTIFIIEAGFLYIKQSQLQNAADAIAIAGVKDEKLITKNRTVDYGSATIVFDESQSGENITRVEVTLTENVTPIFETLFEEVVIPLEVYAVAENKKLVH